ncbi:MAG: hypothetical protein KF797_05520 [Flavobacteriales bacterium]|jgi:hypothetical protein|nr:hypothetical protein [Flavobacteriales bacterium]
MKHSVLPIMFLVNTFLQAQYPALTPPHQGQVACGGAYCIEMVLSGDEVRFYLLDTLGAAVSAWGGVAYVRFADNSTANPVFEPIKDGGFRVVLTNPNAFTVVPSFKTGEGFASVELRSGPRMSIPPIPEQHNAKDGHKH